MNDSRKRERKKVQSNLPLSQNNLRASGPMLLKHESGNPSQNVTPNAKHAKENGSAGVYLKDVKLINQSKDNLNTSQHGRQSLSSQFERGNSSPKGHYMKQTQLASSAANLISKNAEIPSQMTRFIQKKPSSNQKLNNSAGNLYSARNKLAVSQLQNSTLNESSHLNSLLNNHFKAKGQMLPGGLLNSTTTNTGLATAKLMEKIKATKAAAAPAVPIQATKPRQTAPTASRPIDLEVLTSNSNNMTMSSVSAGMTGFSMAPMDHSSKPIPIHSALNLMNKGKHSTSGTIETKQQMHLSKTASGMASSKTPVHDSQTGQFNISLSNAKNVSVYEINNYFGAPQRDDTPKRLSRPDKKEPGNLNHLVNRQSSPKHAEITELYGIQPGYNTGLRDKMGGTHPTTPVTPTAGVYQILQGKPLGKLAHQLSESAKSRMSGVNTMSKDSINESGASGIQRIPPGTRGSVHGEKVFAPTPPQIHQGMTGSAISSMLAKSGFIPSSPKPTGVTNSKPKIGTYLG